MSVNSFKTLDSFSIDGDVYHFFNLSKIYSDFPKIKNHSNDAIVIADGTSCRCQIKDGLNRKAVHLAKFLDENIIY